MKAISERSAEYISTGWQRLRAEGAGKKDLIEAKLHLAYARIDRFNSKDDVAAKLDLAETKKYLESAANQVGAKKNVEVQQISALVTDLEKALNAGDAGHSDVLAFGNAESRLATLIRRL